MPYCTYLIKVDLADGSSKIGAYGTIIANLICIDSNSNNEYILRGYDAPTGPQNVYIANGIVNLDEFNSIQIK